ncbi:DNA-3-methyladenine glycosylase II [Jatrophihabitans sp. GAS493]|uniref:DNA-3-methyladenine glycosylase 2 family protein n=1 Tax=Jatrophihabitans sp. GAS493 TaxID=1907575 RepID=UPI000BB787EC|nr:DNA-3-methyladenine glycosylase 2 family protein [Jatrophihabitans sp. GAS493]SOD70320.1 DNA-3-methyladenine glycosylase II [Jatrophihabitans sp. GAS493]
MNIPDDESCYRAVSGKDARFDGWFFTAVHSTGIYCRPSCPARTPLRRNVSFYPSAAAAQRDGFRACKRCRPDAAPGSPEWDVRGDLAGRAMRLISDGLIDRDGVPGLARRLGYSERQLHRTLVSEVGAGPLALARAQRAQTARILLETSPLGMSEVAFSAGFASVRQFNETMLQIFATTPTQLREKARHRSPMQPGADAVLELRLAYRRPMSLTATLDYLGARAIPGVESIDGAEFARTLRLPIGAALVRLSPGDGFVRCRLALSDQRDLVAAVSRLRGLLDLDADPQAIDLVLGSDASLAPLVEARPGLRSPGSVDPMEMAVRAIVGQQISVSGARTLLGRIVSALGEPLEPEGETSWRLFPSAVTLADCDPALLPMPRARAQTVRCVAAAIVDGSLVLDGGADRDATRAALLEIGGIGPWTADYLVMRVLGDPDVLLGSDLIVRRQAGLRGIDLTEAVKAWSPWGSYASHHLWAGSHDH